MNRLSSILITIVFVVILNNENVCRCDFYTSIGHMMQLINSLSSITNELDYYMNNVTSNNAIRAVNEFKQLVRTVNSNPDAFIGNPVNDFLLIKKLSKDLDDLQHLIFNGSEIIDELKSKYSLPTTNDYEGAAAGLFRLQDTYNIKSIDIRYGNISHVYPSRKLTAMECFELGRIAYNKENYYHAVNWFVESLNQLELEQSRPTVDRYLVLDYLSFCSAQQGNIDHALKISRKLLEINPTNERIRTNIQYYEQLIDEYNKNKNAYEVDYNPFIFKNERYTTQEDRTYEAICRGEAVMNKTKENNQLNCRYVRDNPFLVIGPIKEEQIHKNPDIWLYYDVISDEQINIMKSMALPRLARATISDPVTGELITADYRISKTGWLSEEEHVQLSYMSRLVEAITGLSLSTAEPWQISNYGVGGQYEPHFDFSKKSEPKSRYELIAGNRIATWLLYLDAPEMGGATAFTKLGLRIKPVKRAAAFWYNLLKSGDGDVNTVHAACPVLFGTKWVSNKWIRSAGQIFTRPCNFIREVSGDN